MSMVPATSQGTSGLETINATKGRHPEEGCSESEVHSEEAGAGDRLYCVLEL